MASNLVTPLCNFHTTCDIDITSLYHLSLCTVGQTLKFYALQGIDSPACHIILVSKNHCHALCSLCVCITLHSPDCLFAWPRIIIAGSCMPKWNHSINLLRLNLFGLKVCLVYGDLWRASYCVHHAHKVFHLFQWFIFKPTYQNHVHIQNWFPSHSPVRLLVLVLVITGKGTACILDQHKINTIIKISYTKINLELIKWVSIHDLKQFTVREFTTFSGRLFQSFTILLEK